MESNVFYLFAEVMETCFSGIRKWNKLTWIDVCPLVVLQYYYLI